MPVSIRSAVAAALVCASLAAPAAFAKSAAEDAWEKAWKTFDAEKSANAHNYGPACQDRFASRGEGKVGLGITQIWAKLRTERAWRQAAIKLYGPEYASWRKAKDRTVTCDSKDGVLNCKATATPCK